MRVLGNGGTESLLHAIGVFVLPRAELTPFVYMFVSGLSQASES
jgi:hypothetical protein